MNQRGAAVRARAASGQSAVAEHLRSLIVGGRLQPGARLPTREELVQKTGASSVTLQRTLDQLAYQGLVRTAPRQGTFVSEHPPHLARFGLLFGARDEANLPSHLWSMMARESWKLHDPPQRRMAMYFDIENGREGQSIEQLRADCRDHLLAGLIVSDLYRMTGVLDQLRVPSIAFCTQAELERLRQPHVMAIDLDFWGLIDAAFARLVRLKRRRVAVLAVSGRPVADRARISALAARHGLECPERWVIGFDHRSPAWLASVMELLFTSSAGSPDSLVISDDHLVDAALQSLLRLSLVDARRLEVIVHCNFPAAPNQLYPITRLGFDIPAVLQQCLGLIGAERRGEKPPRVTVVRPRFEASPAGPASLA